MGYSLQEEPKTVIPPSSRAYERKRRKARLKEARLSALQMLIMMAVVFALTFAVRFFVLQVATVDGVSMEGTLYHGERVLISMCDYWFAEPRRGDIVMCAYPDREGYFIKRVIGLPGEMVSIRGTTIYIDGRPIPERYISHPAGEDFGPVSVPEGSYFVIGDNRPVSGDSRLESVGALERERIKGRAVAVVAPMDQFGVLERR